MKNTDQVRFRLRKDEKKNLKKNAKQHGGMTSLFRKLFEQYLIK